MRYIQRLERIDAYYLHDLLNLPPFVEIHDWQENHDERCGRWHHEDQGLDGWNHWYVETDLCTCGMAANVKTYGVDVWKGVGKHAQTRLPYKWFERVKIGQWVVFHEAGHIKVYDDDVFRRLYEIEQ